MCFVLATTPAGGLRGIDFNRDFEHGKTHTACDAEHKHSCFASSPPNRTFDIKCITTGLEGPPMSQGRLDTHCTLVCVLAL